MSGFVRGFAYAFRGLRECLRERNFRFHLCAAAFVIYFAARFYELSRGEWAALFLTVSAVLSLEALNTALERLCDRVSPEKNELVGKCKDCAAGAVLISAAGAVAVGAALFWDTERFSLIAEHFLGAWYRLPLLIAALAAAFCAVFLPKKR